MSKSLTNLVYTIYYKKIYKSSSFLVYLHTYLQNNDLKFSTSYLKTNLQQLLWTEFPKINETPKITVEVKYILEF